MRNGKLKNRVWTLILFVGLSAAMSTLQANNKATTHPVMTKFIDKMVTKHGFEREVIISTLSEVKILPVIIEKMTRPAEAFPWHRYRNIFLKPDRIEQGVSFWQENADDLTAAEKKYGVPAEIIVAILGVETKYGRITGGFRLIDALTTISVDYPKRSKYFNKELEQAFLLAREEKFDLLSLEGSYAGAMGMAQFMPSSYRHYAVDGDGDGIRDLLNNKVDAINSIANYLKRHKWQAGEPIATRAQVSGEKYKKFVKKGMKPKVQLSNIADFSVTAEKEYPGSLKASLIELEQVEGMEYWLGLGNFYSITRYNHSNLYAMAVFQLSQEIKLSYEANES